MDLLKKAITRILAANTLKGAQGEPPLTFSEAQTLISETTAEAGCQPAALKMGSCYTGIHQQLGAR